MQNRWSHLFMKKFQISKYTYTKTLCVRKWYWYAVKWSASKGSIFLPSVHLSFLVVLILAHILLALNLPFPPLSLMSCKTNHKAAQIYSCFLLRFVGFVLLCLSRAHFGVNAFVWHMSLELFHRYFSKRLSISHHCHGTLVRNQLAIIVKLIYECVPLSHWFLW